MQWSFAQAERARKARNNELLRRHHQTQVDNTYTPYLTKFLQLNQAIERYSGPFGYNPNLISRIFYVHILTLNYLDTRPTNNTLTTEHAEVGIQTDDTPVVSTLSLATYINIQKRLDELQRQNRLENQRDQGTSTETDTKKPCATHLLTSRYVSRDATLLSSPSSQVVTNTFSSTLHQNQSTPTCEYCFSCQL